MAAAVASSQTGGPSQDKTGVMAELLYERARTTQGPSHNFLQQELLEFGIIPGNSPATLVAVVSKLTKERLFKATTLGGSTLAWSWRSRDDAKKYASLTQEQAMVYELIDNAGADGIWSRGLRTRTGLIDSVVNKRLRELEQKGLIRDMKSIENPTKKMYIKASLRPSERATGGAWYTDSALDNTFIGILEKFTYDFVRQRSTYLSKQVNGANGSIKVPKKGIINGEVKSEAETVQSKKRTADQLSVDTNSNGKPTESDRPSKKSRNSVLLPLPAGYTEYPTTRQIAEFIDKARITNSIALSVADVQQLVDVLVYDGLIEPVTLGKHKGTGYRLCDIPTADPKSLKEYGNEAKALLAKHHKPGEPEPDPLGAMSLELEDMDMGLTEAPCGRCPVFDLCEEGGPVNPSSCVYFNRWLGLEVP